MKKLVLLGAVVAAALGIAVNSYASFHGATISLQVTNVLAWATTNSGYPSLPGTNVYATNASATNVVYTTVYPTNYTVPATGLAVDISAYDNIGIDVQGFIVTTNTNSALITLTFVTSCANSSPQIIYGTNIYCAGVTNVIQNDWITQNVATTPLQYTFTIATNAAGTTNWFHWMTNVPNTALPAAATYIGLYSMGNAGTNGNVGANGNFITNFSINIEEKQVPKLFAY
jgi:hypothetical protein